MQHKVNIIKLVCVLLYHVQNIHFVTNVYKTFCTRDNLLYCIVDKIYFLYLLQYSQGQTLTTVKKSENVQDIIIKISANE